MIIRELITLFGISTPDQAKLDAFDKSVSAVKSNLVLAMGGALAFGGALLAAAKMTSDAGDKIAKDAQRMGISTDAYQELSHAAELSGTTIGAVGIGVRRLSKLLEDAKTGSAAAGATLKKMGLSAKFAGTADQALEGLADQFAAMPNGMAKSAKAQELFGRGGLALIPMLNEGSKGIRAMRMEAHQLGSVMGEQTLKDAEAFNDQMFRVQQMATGLRNEIGAALMPQITKLGEEFQVWYVANREAIKIRIAEWMGKIIAGAKGVARFVREWYDRLSPLIDKLGGWEKVLGRLAIAFAGLYLVSLTRNIILMGQAFTFAIKSMMAAAIKAAPLYLLAAAVILLGLGIEDLKTYSEGGDSAIGRFLDKFQGADGLIGGTVVAVKELLDALGILQARHGEGTVKRFVSDSAWNDIDQFFLRVVNRFNELKELIPRIMLGLLSPLAGVWMLVGDSAVAALEPVWHRIKLAIISAFEEAKAAVLSSLSGLAGTLSSVPGLGRVASYLGDKILPAAPSAAAQGASAAASAGGQQNITLTSGPVTVQATTGASPEQIGRAVSEAQQEAFAPMLRSAWANSAQGEE